MNSNNTPDGSSKRAGGLRERISGIVGDLKKKADAARSHNGIRIDRQRMKWHILTLLVIALIVTMTIEMFNRRDVGKFFIFVFNHPLMFMLDYFLVLNSIALSSLFRRRWAVIILISVFWIAMSVVNYVVICFRTQPFTLADVLLADDMFSLLTVYFNWFQIIAMFGAIVGVVALVIALFIKLPRRERVSYGPTLLALAAATAMSYGFITIGMNSGFITERFTSIKDAYQKYGFAYTFIDTFADIGISRPKEYSTDVVQIIAEKSGLEEHEASMGGGKAAMPNIIYVQLESFFDVDTLADDIIVSGNATRNFHSLMQNWPSGTLYVPVVGGGTANTEFEVLTGMNLDDFGAGEYPYFTVVRDMPIESAPYVLGRMGYNTAAVHNYMATFYGRNEVYANLGFEVFEPMEYMDDLSYGDVGWATDDSVTESVLDALDSTVGRDFVFAVTVGTHGKYPADNLLECASHSSSIRVIDPGDYLDGNQLANYLNLAKIMDDFLFDFIDEMEDFDEPVVCVFYGDHLPALDWNDACIDSGNLFETQYFIWNNYGAKFTAPDIEAYRLSANLFLQMGIEEGVIFQYHQSADPTDKSIGYLKELEILEYDLLYGDQEVFYGEYPYTPTDLRLGLDRISINNVNYRYGRLMVKGENFNEFSKIVIDDEVKETVYVDSHTLAAAMSSFPKEAESLVVAQISREDIELSRTDEFKMQNVIR